MEWMTPAELDGNGKTEMIAFGRDDSHHEAWLEGDEGGEIEHQQWTRFYLFLA